MQTVLSVNPLLSTLGSGSCGPIMVNISYTAGLGILKQKNIIFYILLGYNNILTKYLDLYQITK